jgi:hypothetical protein
VATRAGATLAKSTGIWLPASEAAPAGPAFVPTDLATLEHWYDADQIEGLNDADPVATWPDLVGTADATQGTATNRPLYRANGLNGASVDFDGSDNFMNAAGVSVSQPDTIFVVVSVDDPFITGRTTFDGATSRQALYWATNWFMYAGSAEVDSGDAVTTGAHYLVATFNGASSSLRLDGAEIATGNPGAAALTSMNIGTFNGSGQFFPGHIKQIGICSEAVAGDDLTSLETYLADKAGL